jgi:hypothetical protein
MVAQSEPYPFISKMRWYEEANISFIREDEQCAKVWGDWRPGDKDLLLPDLGDFWKTCPNPYAPPLFGGQFGPM